MRISPEFPIHLAYCQNIHPGETWGENLQSLREKALAVRDLVAPGDRFGLGLRLGSRAAEDLRSATARGEGLAFFESQNVYPFTVNGFPYGRFHRGPVKEQVYAPDWRSPQRLEYTCALADILEAWLPGAGEASISTVPGSYAAWIQQPSDVDAMASLLAQCVAHLALIQRNQDKFIHLGLEPEPDCFLETTAQTVHFFEHALPRTAIPLLSGALQISHARAEETLRRHLGVCFDTCHIALQYENLTDSLDTLEKAGIKVSKIQLSAALKAPPSPEGINALRNFHEPTYLHQVKGRLSDGALHSWPDLPEALEQAADCRNLEELRVHFHVPLFFAPQAPLLSTRDALDTRFWQKIRSGICPHVEIETYTFDVLPPEAHPGDVVRSISEEYRWVLAQTEGVASQTP
jgi:sugar phosphate isomerase/epimerase